MSLLFSAAITGQMVNAIKKNSLPLYSFTSKEKKITILSRPRPFISVGMGWDGKGKKRGGFGDGAEAWAGGAPRQNLNISQQARPQMGREWEALRRE